MFQKEKPKILYKSNKSLNMLQSRMSQYAGHDVRPEIIIHLLLYGCNLSNFFFVFRGAKVSDCGQWLIIIPRLDCRDNLLLFFDLKTLPNNEISGKVNLTQVVHKFEADYQVMLILYILKIIKELIFDM